MSKLYFEKYANFDRINEPVRVSIPIKKGEVTALDKLRIIDSSATDTAVSQARALGYWGDGSIKWAKVDFMANLPANKDAMYGFDFNGTTGKVTTSPIKLDAKDDTLAIDNGCINLTFGNKAGAAPFHSLRHIDFYLGQEQIDGPYIFDDNNIKYNAMLNTPWTIEENGPVLVKLSAAGTHKSHSNAEYMDFIITVTVYANTPWFEIGYRIINKQEPDYSFIKKIAFDLHFDKEAHGTHSIATSNYLSNIKTESGEQNLHFMIDADYLISDANEHIPEVFYGTFFADWNSKKGGICATLYQAYQNFPKAFTINKSIMSIQLLPEDYESLKYYRGMAKNHTLFLHLHSGDEPIDSINKRSLMLQHTDKPILPAYVYEESGCYPRFFAKNKWPDFESLLIGMADNRGKAYGILHWGDCPDSGYSQQGRGGGDYVWTNNEYDFPYAAMQLYARTGIRRMLDYALTAAAHWVDIDVCHYDHDPLKHGAQIEHSKDHVTGNVEISHEWVEGLFAYYYQTGDKFTYDTAIGIGQNIMRHLDEPRYQKKGEVNARETGWALRALTAIYLETNDKSWLKHADFIVSHFKSWKETYGGWFAPYTNHTVVRVPFMISVAVASLMRYYWVKPDESIKAMIIDAMDDLLENAVLDNGMFYYKELPSLNKPGPNPIPLEALACAYELTGDEKYLQAGVPLFMLKMKSLEGAGRKKDKIPGGLLQAGPGPKAFAQSFYPLAYYYYHVSNTGILKALIE